MKIKPCAHCGGEAYIEEVKDEDLSLFPFRVICGCGVSTLNYRDRDIVIDIWNSRAEGDPTEADRWLKEATEQRERADRIQAERDELGEYINQLKRMLVYAGGGS